MAKTVLSALLVCGMALVGATFAQHPAQAQEREHHAPAIMAPADGTTVSNPVNVAFGFPGRDGGEAEHHEHQGGEHHGHGPHAVLLVDAPMPEAGATVPEDANHLAFPEGQRQTTVTLTPGQHVLRLIFLDREGNMNRRGIGSDPVTITVQ